MFLVHFIIEIWYNFIRKMIENIEIGRRGLYYVDSIHNRRDYALLEGCANRGYC